MKPILLTIWLCLIFIFDVKTQTFTGDTILSSQTEVNDFGRNNYSYIDGIVTISGATITDLNPLLTLD